MEPAGHGTEPVDEASAVRPQKRAGSLVVIGHEKFPFLLGAVVEHIGVSELGPEPQEARKAFPALDEHLFTRKRVEPVKTFFQERRIEKRDVEEPPTALGTPFSAADVFA